MATGTDTDAGIIRGYEAREPQVTRTSSGGAVIDAHRIYYRQLNACIQQLISEGVRDIRITGVNGQRYIADGLCAPELKITIEGVPGQDLAMLMSGPTVEVFGNAQDGVGNTMDAGTVIVHGGAGDVIGYGMRGGTVLLRGDVGYRVGIHMKEYKTHIPAIVCGGKARDFFGEYMAGGRLILLGDESQLPGPVVGSFVGSGMHGGQMFIRGHVESWQCGKEAGITQATGADLDGIAGLIKAYAAAFDRNVDELLSVPFTKIAPLSSRPYANLYLNL